MLKTYSKSVYIHMYATITKGHEFEGKHNKSRRGGIKMM